MDEPLPALRLLKRRLRPAAQRRAELTAAWHQGRFGTLWLAACGVKLLKMGFAFASTWSAEHSCALAAGSCKFMGQLSMVAPDVPFLNALFEVDTFLLLGDVNTGYGRSGIFPNLLGYGLVAPCFARHTAGSQNEGHLQMLGILLVFITQVILEFETHPYMSCALPPWNVADPFFRTSFAARARGALGGSHHLCLFLLS